jgi:uncharacterized protein YjbJ (UPF0337 family)
MKNTIAEGRWKRMRARAKEQWGNFRADPIDRTDVKFEKLAGVLQEKYGYALGKADEILERRLKDEDQKHSASALRARRMDKRQFIGW